MIWILENANGLFILFPFPILGLIIDLFLDNKKTVKILIITSILLTPILSGYTYIIPYTYQVLALIILSCLYSLYSKKIGNKVPKFISAIIISVLLFLILGFTAFASAMAGTQTIEKEWRSEGYKIEYIRDQGFSGKPLMKYELNKYGFIPIFIKEIEVVNEDESSQNCYINFTKGNVLLNKCSGEIEIYK